MIQTIKFVNPSGIRFVLYSYVVDILTGLVLFIYPLYWVYKVFPFKLASGFNITKLVFAWSKNLRKQLKCKNYI